jgi:outer membrane immunogenic protein
MRLVTPTTCAALIFAAAFPMAISSANAEDELAPASPPSDMWSGFYFGAFGGVASADVDVPDLFTDAFGGAFYTFGANSYSLSPEGLIVGGHAGFDWQWNRLVVGLGGELGLMDLDDSVINPHVPAVPAPASLPYSTFESDWYGALTGRVGISLDRVLIYARGGAAFLNVEGSTIDPCGRSFCGQTKIEAFGDDVVWGWTIGGGAEAMITNHIRLGAEYRFYDFQSFEVSGTATNLLEYSQDMDIEGIQTGRVFLSYVW